MKICPSCREEFLDHIEICAICDERLLNECDAKAVSSANSILSKEEIFQEETGPFVEGTLAHCKEIEKVLVKSLVSCVVYPVSLSCESNPATLGSSCDMKYMVLVRLSDMDKAKMAMEGQFSDAIAKEGRGQFVRDAINLDEEIITCPACGESNALKDGECPVCGLCLGVPNP